MEASISSAKSALEAGELEGMKKASDELNQLNSKLAEKVYAQAAQQQPGADAAGGDAEAGAQAAGASDDQAKAEKKKDDDDVVDADFKEV